MRIGRLSGWRAGGVAAQKDLVRCLVIRNRNEAFENLGGRDGRRGSDFQQRQRAQVAKRAAVAVGVVRFRSAGEGCRLRPEHEAQKGHNRPSPPVVTAHAPHVGNLTIVGASRTDARGGASANTAFSAPSATPAGSANTRPQGPARRPTASNSRRHPDAPGAAPSALASTLTLRAPRASPAGRSGAPGCGPAVG